MKRSTIADYYNETQPLYTLFWPKDTMHFGFWEKGTKSLSEAVVNTNKFVVKILGIKKKDKVLDAGCGIGATVRYISKNTGADVTGITLSDVQITSAKKKSKGLDKVNFFKNDYTKTGFKNATFTKIYGIESICHAESKLKFIKEAYRLLSKKGKLAVIDAFLIKDKLNSSEKKDLDAFLKGMVLPNLSRKTEFEKYLKDAGFKKVKYIDKLKEVKPTTRIMSRLGYMGYPFLKLLGLIKVVPKSMAGHSVSCINQKRLVDNKLATYGVFVAEK